MSFARTTRVLLTLLLAAVLPATAAAGHNEDGSNGSATLIYTYDEMFAFDTETYLAANAPQLLAHAEAISHWAGYTTISPRVLLALMEMETGVITGQDLPPDVYERPFGDLSAEKGAAEQVRDVADQLATFVYERRGSSPESAEFGELPAPSALHALFARADRRRAADADAPARTVEKFVAVFAGLFQDKFQATGQDSPVALGPPSGLLRFPFPVGATWHVGGAHTNNGSGSYPLSSLDMYRGGGWGSNQSSYWVSASAGGSFKRHSSCFAEVVHSGGWSTTYYHLMNIRYSTGATVSQSAAIANPANTKAQALCNGGSSTGPHQHWSLKYNGSYYHLNDGVYLTGYRITATGTSYDTNCNRFYLTKNGQKYCAGWFTN